MGRRKDEGTTDTPSRDAQDASTSGETTSTTSITSTQVSSDSLTLPAFGLAEDILATLPQEVGAIGTEAEPGSGSPSEPLDAAAGASPTAASPPADADAAHSGQQQEVATAHPAEPTTREPGSAQRLQQDLLASAIGGEDDGETDATAHYDSGRGRRSFSRGGADGPEDGDQERDRLLQLVTFFLDQEEYGIPITRVQEINRVVEVTRVPNSPEHVMGVMNLRGKIVPVIELKRRLRLGETKVDRDARIVVVERGPKILGLMVDRVAQVLQIPASSIDRTPDEVVRAQENYTLGVGRIDDRMVIVLDVDKVVEGTQQGTQIGHA